MSAVRAGAWLLSGVVVAASGPAERGAAELVSRVRDEVVKASTARVADVGRIVIDLSSGLR
jgi:hypothetical protein